MTKTFTQTNFKNLSKSGALEHSNETVMESTTDNQNFYDTIKPKLDSLYREPSEETIAKILNYAKKR